MGIQYFCKNKNRRQTVRDTKDQNGKPVINGIDYLEVGTDQKVLKVYFIHNFLDVPSATVLSKDKVIIEGGERIKGIQVVEPFNTQNNILTVNVDKSGDFSTYTLRLVKSATDKDLPDGFDPQLSNVDFSFKINCPSDFDCQKKRVCLSEPKKQPDINYIAKDYASFRQLMFDRLSVLMPDWQERNPADLGIALVELLAYAGDYLSYQQDAVATEAYLGTARSRISVRRHARLVDYFMYNGCNARTCVWIKVNKGSSADGATLTANTPLLTQMSNYNVIVDPSKLKEIVEIEKPVVF